MSVGDTIHPHGLYSERGMAMNHRRYIGAYNSYRRKTKQHHPQGVVLFILEQGTGIEPASVAWEATILPMN